MEHLNKIILGSLNPATLWSATGVLLLLGLSFVAVCMGRQLYENLGNLNGRTDEMTLIKKANLAEIFESQTIFSRNQPLSDQNTGGQCSKGAVAKFWQRHLQSSRRRHTAHHGFHRKACTQTK